MNIQQLKFFIELVRNDFNASRTAKALGTSQPNVSMSLQALERDLGLRLLKRKDRRIVGLTENGQLIAARARSLLGEFDQIMAIAETNRNRAEQLNIITTHSQARYLLPNVIERFVKEFADVRLSVNQGKNDEIVDSLLSGQAEVGLFNSSITNHDGLVFIPYGTCDRIIIAPLGHEIADTQQPKLTDLTCFPIVIYEPATSNSAVVATLEQLARNSPQVIHCTNTDVVKSYVKRGIGISVVPDFVYSPAEDPDLVAINASHLFPSPTLYVVLKRQEIRNPRIYDLLRFLSPSLPKSVVDKAIAQASAG